MALVKHGITEATPSELMFERFCELYLPAKIVPEELYEKYYGYEDYGFVAYMANVSRIRSLGSEMYLPRVMSSSKGLLESRGWDKLALPYANFFDGIMVSSQLDELRAEYSVPVYAPMQLDTDWYENVAALIAAYNASEKEIDRYNTMTNKRAFKSSYTGTFDANGMSLAKTYVEEGDKAYRAKIDRYLSEADAYSDFVYQTYTGKADSDIIRALAQTLLTQSYADDCYAASYVDEEAASKSEFAQAGPWPSEFLQ